MTDVLATPSPDAPARWPRIMRHATTKLGAFGATAAVLIGACGPAATQCAPAAPVPAPAPVEAPAPATDIRLAAKALQAPCSFTDTWGAARSGGRVHLGTDITAAEGQEVYAVQTGEIAKVYSEGTDVLAGNGVRLRQADGTFWAYFHLSALAPGIAAGTQVVAGQLLGWVGHTGNAGGPHLHLELHPGGGEAVNSYPVIVASGGPC